MDCYHQFHEHFIIINFVILINFNLIFLVIHFHLQFNFL